MATQVLEQVKCWLDSYDLSGDLNAVAIAQTVEQQEATTFGSDTRITKPSLKTIKASLAGLINLGAGLSEEFLSSKLTLADVPLTIGPQTGAEGEPGISFLASLASFNPVSGKIGDLLNFALDAAATNSK